VGWTEERVSTQSVSVHTADVTADWVDVAARIENAKREEARLHTLLDEQTGTLADVLAVERELSRVRGEIERAEGRMRVLSDQVAMSTLTLEVMVRAPYETYVSETFGHQAARVFTSSLDVMGATARGLALAVIAMIPWLVVLGAGLAALIAVFRRMSQRRR
jgi:hypothetical protein